jgi:hypothetical protein
MQPVVEGMTPTDEVTALQKAASNVSITNIIPSRSKLPLREYCIKASYSSAFSGTYVSADMIKYVLRRGCRYLDIPIFYSTTDNIPYVAHITDSKAIDSASDNKIPHVTIATPQNGKAVKSNMITDWTRLNKSIKLSGIVSAFR